MKKLFSAGFILVLITSTIICKENLFSFTSGLSTGMPLYGSQQTTIVNETIENPARVIVGTYSTINFNPIKQLTFFTGADLLTDFIWKNNQHANHIHFNIPFGIKIYPNLGGLCFGLSYLLGFRADFINIKDTPSFNGIKSWGNGFKFLAEYNFTKNSNSNNLPIVGFSWGIIPRGSYAYDNIFQVYLGFNY